MADSDSWDAENFEPAESSAKKPVALLDKWEGEDEDEDVKDNWDDEEEEAAAEAKKAETKVSEKKKLNEKIKEKERKHQEELRKRLKEAQEAQVLTPEEEADERLRQKQAQEEADMELAREAFGVESNAVQKNSVSGIDGLNPRSREDFVEFEKLLREKITQYDQSIHYSTFLESLFRELCISLELEDLKKISSSLTVLLNEKQKQEKQLAKGKKKKKTNLNLAGGGLKAKKKDDLDDYGGGGAGYEQDYEDFM